MFAFMTNFSALLMSIQSSSSSCSLLAGRQRNGNSSYLDLHFFMRKGAFQRPWSRSIHRQVQSTAKTASQVTAVPLHSRRSPSRFWKDLVTTVFIFCDGDVAM